MNQQNIDEKIKNENRKIIIRKYKHRTDVKHILKLKNVYFIIN